MIKKKGCYVMICLYTGTGGSSKSYHTARVIYDSLIKGYNVISSFPINVDYVRKPIYDRKGNLKRYKRQIGDCIYRPYNMLTVEFLVAYAELRHKKGIEGQTLVVIDECQIMFDPRTIKADRAKWILFMCLHRHYGFDIILITQSKSLIDRQIRNQCEYEVKHRCLNHNGIFGKLLPFKLFTAVWIWNGIRSDYSTYFLQKRYYKIYDSYTDIDNNNMLLIDSEYKKAVDELRQTGVGGSQFANSATSSIT